MSEEKEKRKSKISKSVRRIYNVAQYESLELVINYEEEIDWDTIKERQQKSKNITSLLLDDFKNTRKEVFEELNESEKKAYFKNALKSMKATEDELENFDTIE